ncbi:MAG TPA: ATP synthase F1 subunit delta [Ktedonobacterales bacterium]|nr:ATP synthase F1 subunit delta [Ktedonobacterales bacterium]
MLKGAIARRYAEAVMEIAQSDQSVDRWLADIQLIGEAFGDRHLAFILREPKVPARRKELILRDLLAAKVSPAALNLALVLNQDGLVEIGPRLAQEFEKLYDDYRGQARGEVTTAMPLAPDERTSIAADLQRITGKRILLEERVDPAILGGVVARVGDTLIDGSVRRRLHLLREQIALGTGPFFGPSDGTPAPDGAGGPGGGPDGSTPPAGGSPVGGAPGAPQGGGNGTPSGPVALAHAAQPSAGGAPHVMALASGTQALGQPAHGGVRSSTQQSRRNGRRNRRRRH